MTPPNERSKTISENLKGRGITVTIKYGKSYEHTWAVFNGSVEEVRNDIVSYFGLDGASVAELTLSELVVNVTNLAHGKGNVAALLGGTVIPSQSSEPAAQPQTDEAQQPGTDPWAGVEGGEPEPEVNPLHASIAACVDVPALQRLWAENQAAFQDADLLAAWKARGKALSGAAS